MSIICSVKSCKSTECIISNGFSLCKKHAYMTLAEKTAESLEYEGYEELSPDFVQAYNQSLKYDKQ